MAPVHRAVDAENRSVPTEVDRVMVGERGGEAVPRRRLRRVVGDDRPERHQCDETEQESDPAICRDPEAPHERAKLAHFAELSLHLADLVT